MDLNNKVIEVIDINHGKKVKKFFEEHGINTENFAFCCTKKDGYFSRRGTFIHNPENRYYGLKKGVFNNFSEVEISEYKLEIITLPEETDNQYPKVMWVSQVKDFYEKYKRVVFAEKCGKYLAWDGAETIEDAEKQLSVVSWKYAKNIDPIELNIEPSIILQEKEMVLVQQIIIIYQEHNVYVGGQPCYAEYYTKVKTDSNNEIIIKLIKNSYSKEELQIFKGSTGNHLEWIYQRLVSKHGENPNYDYMIKLKELSNWISENL